MTQSQRTHRLALHDTSALTLEGPGIAVGSRQRLPGESTWSSRLVAALRWLTLVVFVAAGAYYIAASWRWRLSIDSPVMHYVVFLLRHGLTPYAQISDNNMPGAYLTEAAAMRVFGGSDLGWRVYEYTLLAGLTVVLSRLARDWDWMAGVLAGLLFLVLHANEGPQYAGERELVLTVCLLLAFLALFAAVDRNRPVWMGVFGLLAGLAVDIKPSFAPLPLAVLALAVAVLWRRQGPWRPALAWALGGLGAVIAATLGYLLHKGVLREFVFVLRTVTPAYLGLPSTVTNAGLLQHSLPHSGFLFLAMAVLVGICNRREHGPWTWKQWALLLGAAFGFLSYFLQHKGFSHHRYTFCIFLFLLGSVELFQALGSPGRVRWVAAAALVLTLAMVPHPILVTGQWSASSDVELAMERDLDRLGGASTLQHQVQCFDLVYGCLNALYHEGLLENTGFTGDLLFFSKGGGAATEYYRQRYREAERQQPATVLVVSNEELLLTNNYGRLDRWPEFARDLQANYVQVAERQFPNESYGTHSHDPGAIVAPADQDGYRLYLRRSSPALARWQATAP